MEVIEGREIENHQQRVPLSNCLHGIQIQIADVQQVTLQGV